MKADTLSLAQVFNKPVSFLVPLFQRPYVWEQEKHWYPLWEDIQTVAERLLSERRRATAEDLERGQAEARTPPHFLGALVVEQLLGGAGMVDRRRVIDGQQRLTTLQLFLDAAHDVAQEIGDENAKLFKKLTDNDPDLVRDLSDTYKIWPTNADRLAFRITMRKEEDTLREKKDVSRSSISLAHIFFSGVIKSWLDEPREESVAERLDALRTVLWSLVRMVVIDLDPNDNAQVIFETLNARGTPLLAADLIKNAVFQSAIEEHLDAEDLYARYWARLDEDWWRKEVRQGRLFRPRLDVFFTHWLTMRKGSEFGVHELFTEFKRFSARQDGSTEDLLSDMVRYADVYQSFSNQPPGSLEATFFHRLDVMQTTTATPLLIYVMGLPEETLKTEQRHRILLAIESWLARRLLSRLTTKNYNLLFLQLLSRVLEDSTRADHVTVDFLSNLEGESGRWPNEEDLRTALLTLPLYKVLGRGRVRMTLEALEEALRAEHPGFAEAPAPVGLSIEHILPQAWNTGTWPLPEREPPEVAAQRRDVLKHTLGNLTLITGKLNSAQSNLPWDKKREQLRDFTVLYLNKMLMDESLTWDETAIEERGKRLASLATKIWPGPQELMGPHVPHRPEPLFIPDQSKRPAGAGVKRVSATREQFEEFWSGFLSIFRQRFPDWGRRNKPSRGTSMGVPSGRGGVWYIARLEKGRLAVHLNVRKPGVFEYLLARRTQIEQRFGGALVWDPLEGQKSSRVSVTTEGLLGNRDRWGDYQHWFVDTLSRLHEAILPDLMEAGVAK